MDVKPVVRTVRSCIMGLAEALSFEPCVQCQWAWERPSMFLFSSFFVAVRNNVHCNNRVPPCGVHRRLLGWGPVSFVP